MILHLSSLNRSQGAQNVIAAIDPTFRDQNEYRSQGRAQPPDHRLPDHRLDEVPLPVRQGHNATGSLHHHTGW